MDAAERLADAVVARIEAGGFPGELVSLEQLTAGLGRSGRQIRRVLRQVLGVTAVELSQTHRLLLAKRLLTETSLPITQVALASGFGSLRRFHALFRARYRLPPSDLRKNRDRGSDTSCVQLTLAYRPPLAWPALMQFLGQRALAGVESVAGLSYARTVTLGSHQGWLRVAPVSGQPVLRVEASLSLVPVLQGVLARMRRLLDLDARPDVIDAHLSRDPRLEAAITANPGLRVAGAFDPFELLLRAILGQQVSVRAATTLAGRFAATFGEPVTTPWSGLRYTTPSAAKIARADQATLVALGVTSARAECVRTLASAVASGELSLEPMIDPEQQIAHLQSYPGIGPWTATYVVMRGVRWPDAFPVGDLGLQKVFGHRSPRKLAQQAEPWRPWRAYAAMHAWMGFLTAEQKDQGHAREGLFHQPAQPAG